MESGVDFVADGQEVVSQTKGSTTAYLWHDGQGSVRDVFTPSGTITESYLYDAYGNLRSGQATPTSTYLYTGQQFDTATGLYNLRARLYNPAAGRFLSQDSADYDQQNPMELNRYAYTADNPINSSDPSGQSAVAASTAPCTIPPSAASQTCKQEESKGGGTEYSALVSTISSIAKQSLASVGNAGVRCALEYTASYVAAATKNKNLLLQMDQQARMPICVIPIYRVDRTRFPNVAAGIDFAQFGITPSLGLQTAIVPTGNISVTPEPMLLNYRWGKTRDSNNNNRAEVCTYATKNALRRVISGTSCDEYPFNASWQGGRHGGTNNASAAGVPGAENSRQGSDYGSFLRGNNRQSYNFDPFGGLPANILNAFAVVTM